MNKICTTIDQSKKLIELGIDVNNADMAYGYIAPYDFSDRMYDGGYDEIPYIKDFFKVNSNFSENEYDGGLLAWSLSALMELIQDDIKIEKTLFDQSDMFTYSIIGDAYEYRSHEHECLLDAAFEFVCWLLENKKL